jgi:hypothetical protein
MHRHGISGTHEYLQVQNLSEDFSNDAIKQRSLTLLMNWRVRDQEFTKNNYVGGIGADRRTP